MGKEPGPGTEHVDPTPPMPFLEDPEPEGTPAPAAAEPEGAEEWEPPTQEQYEADLARIENAEDATKAARAQVEQNNLLMRDLVGRTPPPTQEAEPEEPGPMPDAAREPEQFAAWLNKRDAHAEAKFNKQLRGIQANIHQNSRASDLFAEFVAQYPAMADKRDLVESAARASGIRPTDTKDAIFAGVVQKLGEWGFEVEAAPSGDPPTRSRGGRTAGVAAGSGQRRTRRPAPAEEKSVDLIDAITQDQVNIGIM